MNYSKSRIQKLQLRVAVARVLPLTKITEVS